MPVRNVDRKTSYQLLKYPERYVPLKYKLWLYPCLYFGLFGVIWKPFLDNFQTFMFSQIYLRTNNISKFIRYCNAFYLGVMFYLPFCI